MKFVQRKNKILKVEDSSVPAYENMGYVELDEKYIPVKKETDSNDVEKLKETIKKLKAEIKELKAAQAQVDPKATASASK